MIRVPTIRHSGSHFLVDLLGADINKTIVWAQIKNANEDSVIFDHIAPTKAKFIIPLIKEHLTLIPLRHPYLIEKSWDDRQKDKDDLYSALETLINEIDPYRPYYLPLDAQDRESYLNAIRAVTGLTLHTKWQGKGVRHNNQALRHTDVTPSTKMKDFVKEQQSFFDRFYRVAI